MAMHVIFPGPRTTIQDLGRTGYQNSGFGPGGFIDRAASARANALVGNSDDEAVIEFCLIGPVLQFDEEVNLAVCGGDFGIDVEGTVYSADKAVHVPAGAAARITTGSVGIYGSIAVAGGLAIPVVMGSRSTSLRCGFGGFEGRALMAGDIIALRHPEKGREDLSRRWVPARQPASLSESGAVRIRVIPGPQEDMFTGEGLRTFYESAYEISSHSDRMGFRLRGPAVEAKSGYDILSDGVVNGSVQISGAGEPIVMMADRQTTGGYAKIATVISVDIPVLAQLRPGQKVQFAKCAVQEAQRLIREADSAWKQHRRMLDEGIPEGLSETADGVRPGKDYAGNPAGDSMNTSNTSAGLSAGAQQREAIPVVLSQGLEVEIFRPLDEDRQRFGWKRRPCRLSEGGSRQHGWKRAASDSGGRQAGRKE
ncbi:MAG: biotin-dependent carboxyltransferase family protein [Eubacteriales bacterium]|nr:biotin-dependent carboxyltransferase family protein [Eubacteriales bacterium]